MHPGGVLAHECHRGNLITSRQCFVRSSCRPVVVVVQWLGDDDRSYQVETKASHAHHGPAVDRDIVVGT